MQKQIVKVLNLTDQISAEMMARISGGEFSPGSQLPTALELSTEFGVSRTVVREAISRLKSEGLVVARQGAGVFVSEDKLKIPFRIQASADSPDFTIKVLELRLAVESEAAALAAERATKSQLKKMHGTLDAMRSAYTRGEDGVNEDVLFHRLIAEAANNHLYSQLSDFLERHARHQMLSGGKEARVARTMRAQEEHEKIYKAIASANPDLARNAARKHFQNSIERRIGSGSN